MNEVKVNDKHLPIHELRINENIYKTTPPFKVEKNN
jgi:hypothetical protein